MGFGGNCEQWCFAPMTQLIATEVGEGYAFDLGNCDCGCGSRARRI